MTNRGRGQRPGRTREEPKQTGVCSMTTACRRKSAAGPQCRMVAGLADSRTCMAKYIEYGQGSGSSVSSSSLGTE